MVRESAHTDDANAERRTGRGPLARVVDTIRDLLTDPPHDPDHIPVGPGGPGLEWK
ncbi:hypothetical protein [Nocardiopsis synnemataformans]|uniref:hypothetical protein n=1 Tax=Nocardiopsis synnemataformans TaxID=61305 RepID=UPI003EBC347A